MSDGFSILWLMTDPMFIRAARTASVSELELATGQQKVVDLAVNQSTCVFGSPGSGKTTALVARYLALVAGGLNPKHIQVFAATRDSANSLRDQLALELQAATPGPIAKTINSFAFGLLAGFAKANGEKSPDLISGSEQDRILKQVLENQPVESWPKQIDKSVLSLIGFRTQLRDLLAVCFEYGIGAASLRELAVKHSVPQWEAAAIALENYLSLVAQSDRMRIDAPGLVRLVADGIATGSMKPTEAIKAILVDDAQELTPSASKLLFELSKTGAGLVLFGDPDVATLGFRAANPRTMSNLIDAVHKDSGSTCDAIYLEPTHAVRRPEISSALAKISSQIEVARAGRQRKGLQPPADLIKGDGLKALVFSSVSDESAYLAGALRKRHLFDSVPWSKMAVVARSRPELEALSLRLASESVPVRILGSSSSLRDEHAAGELLFLAGIAISDEKINYQQAIELLASEFCGLDQLGILRLKRSLRKLTDDYQVPSEELIVEVFENPNTLSLLRIVEARKAENLIRSMAKAKQLALSQDATAEAVLWQLLQDAKVIDRWAELSRGVSEIAIQAGKNLDSVMSLFAAAARFSERNPDAKASEFIRDQLERDVPEDSLALNNFSGEYVQLITPSGLIGKRFDTVLLPGLIEGVWPNLSPRSSLLGATALAQLLEGEINSISELDRSELPGELRMLNKAVGAATNLLVLSATDLEQEQLSQFLALVNGGYPSVETQVPNTYTLRSMVGSLRRELAKSATSPSHEVAMGLARLAAAGVPGADPANWYGRLPVSTSEPLTDTQSEVLRIRPSQLENFLKCPLHWFLETHGGSQGSFQASLGSLVHEVLELSTSSDLAELEKLRLSRWNSLEFEADWLEDLGKRAAARMLGNLAKYLAEFEKSGGTVLAKEQDFEFALGNIQVKGQVDRIEKLDDGSVLIVDLKTGNKAASEADTLTNPQLALYQMAVLEGGFEQLSLNPEQLAGAKLLIVGGQNTIERKQPAMTKESSAGFKKILLDASEGMSKSVFIANLDSHCHSEREYGSCSLQITRAVSYVG